MILLSSLIKIWGIPARSAKLVKIRIEGDWRGEGFVESITPELQESGRKYVLLKTRYVENHMHLTVLSVNLIFICNLLLNIVSWK